MQGPQFMQMWMSANKPSEHNEDICTSSYDSWDNLHCWLSRGFKGDMWVVKCPSRKPSWTFEGKNNTWGHWNCFHQCRWGKTLSNLKVFWKWKQAAKGIQGRRIPKYVQCHKIGGEEGLVGGVKPPWCSRGESLTIHNKSHVTMAVPCYQA